MTKDELLTPDSYALSAPELYAHAGVRYYASDDDSWFGSTCRCGYQAVACIEWCTSEVFYSEVYGADSINHPQHQIGHETAVCADCLTPTLDDIIAYPMADNTVIEIELCVWWLRLTGVDRADIDDIGTVQLGLTA
jgi:hypothetical protein